MFFPHNASEKAILPSESPIRAKNPLRRIFRSQEPERPRQHQPVIRAKDSFPSAAGPPSPFCRQIWRRGAKNIRIRKYRIFLPPAVEEPNRQKQETMLRHAQV